GRWSVRLGAGTDRNASEGCEPGVFAELIRKYLQPITDVSRDEDAPRAVFALPASLALPDRRTAVIAAAHVAASWARARASWDSAPLDVQDVPADAQDVGADVQ